jgi:hypothetical protein
MTIESVIQSMVPFVAGLFGGVVATTINYFLNRRKSKLEMEKISLEIIKLKIGIEGVSSEIGETRQEVSEHLRQISPSLSDTTKKETSVKILNPQNEAKVQHAVPIKGTVEGLLDNMELWIVKEIAPGNYHPDRGPIFVTGNTWSATAYVGHQTHGADTGIRFIIHIVMVSHESGKKFNNYIDTAHRTGGWSGIDTIYDGKIVATLSVVRNDFGWEQ